MTHSISPAGESFLLPTQQDYNSELNRIEALVQQARSKNKEIVVVMGVGFRFQVPSSKFQVPSFKFQVPSFKLGAYNLKPAT